MGEVRIGDLLFDGAGTPCRVIACSPVMVDRPCFRVTFSDGASIIADAEHRWHTFTVAERSALSRRTEGFRARRRATRARRGSGKRPDLAARNAAEHHGMQPPPTGAVRTTAEIAGTVTLGVRANHSVTVAGPINLPPAELPIPPYILGAWLGDGTSSGAGFTCHDAEILAEVEREGYRPRPQNAPGAYGILGLRAQLRLASLLGNKHIPATYLRASTSQRLALLQGLMDTDGYADARGQCEISLTNHALTEGVLELVRSLGIKATIREGRATLDGRVIGPKWRVKFITDLPAFRLPRKVDRQKRSGFRGTHALRYITAVEPVESVPVRCVAVDSPSRLYLAGREMIPTHNTDLLLGIAGTQHRRSIIFRRVFPSLAAVIDRSKELFSEAGVYNVTHSRWALAAGPSIEFASVQLESDLRKYQGQPHDLVAVDECTEFPEKFVRFLSGWNRTTTPGQRCRVVMTFNPPTDSDGEWVIRYFAPWVDDEHPDPAKDGELRWYAMVDGETGKAVEREFKRREDVPAGVLAQSRTFFHAFLSDNPILEQTGYGATIDALPEPLRSILRGQFDAARQEDPWQGIPIAWVRAAQACRCPASAWTWPAAAPTRLCWRGATGTGSGPWRSTRARVRRTGRAWPVWSSGRTRAAPCRSTLT